MGGPEDTRISDAVLDEIEAGLADAAVLLKLHEDVHKPVLRLNPAAVRAAFTELRERRANDATHHEIRDLGEFVAERKGK